MSYDEEMKKIKGPAYLVLDIEPIVRQPWVAFEILLGEKYTLNMTSLLTRIFDGLVCKRNWPDALDDMIEGVRSQLAKPPEDTNGVDHKPTADIEEIALFIHEVAEKVSGLYDELTLRDKEGYAFYRFHSWLDWRTIVIQKYGETGGLGWYFDRDAIVSLKKDLP
jgi:hypothetical protein